MARTLIQLTKTQARRLRGYARQHDISLAEAIRRCIDKGLAEQAEDRAALYARAARLVGRFPDSRGAQNLADRHDRYLDAAFG
jgi:hypothetical protein